MSEPETIPTPLPPNVEAVVDAVRAAWPESIAGDDMRDRVLAIHDQHQKNVRQIETMLISVALFWAAGAINDTGDEEAVEQVVLGQMMRSLCVVAAGLKARRGVAVSPGRLAIAMYGQACALKSLGDVKPADLSKADQILEALTTPIEAERDRLRAALKSILVAHIEQDPPALLAAVDAAAPLLGIAESEASC